MIFAMTTAAAALSLVTCQDGSLQGAMDDMPLYHWVGDTKPGDTKGDGVGGTWHLAR